MSDVEKLIARPLVGATPQGTLRLCGYCKSWNSHPCGEQCVLQPTDPTWEEALARAAQQGADTP